MRSEKTRRGTQRVNAVCDGKELAESGEHSALSQCATSERKIRGTSLPRTGAREEGARETGHTYVNQCSTGTSSRIGRRENDHDRARSGTGTLLQKQESGIEVMQ